MIYVYGDSHAYIPFVTLKLNHNNFHQPGITMFKIGRDNKIVNHHNNHNSKENIFVLIYGEIDCRCHIGKQVKLGRTEDEIIDDLVNKYFQTIKLNIG